MKIENKNTSKPASKTQNELKQVLNYVDNIINKPLPAKYIRPYCQQVYNKVGIKPETQCRVVLFVTTIYLAIGVFARVFVAMGGFLIPAFKSTRALENGDQNETRHWLCYWVIYTAMIFIDSVADSVLHFIPFYDMLKAMMLIYAMNNGAVKIYEFAIQPYADSIISIPRDQVELLRRDSDLGLMNLMKNQGRLQALAKASELNDIEEDIDGDLPCSPRGDVK